jgi:hypothetical protein
MSAPPLIEITFELWTELVAHLQSQGGGVRESGAFLLGRNTSTTRMVTGFLPYEKLQADALHEDYVLLTAKSFSKLWTVCQEHHVSVVADVHTHRFGPQQSHSDKSNPMIALAGHIALIVPKFAQGEIQISDIGVHIYRGNHQWTSQFGTSVPTLIRLVEF